jgi:hypothetical protein
MAPVLFSGAPPAAPDGTDNEKAPSVAGGAQKIPVRDIQRTRNLLESPLKADSRMREAHIVTVRSKSRMTILLKMPHALRNTGSGSERPDASGVANQAYEPTS